MTKITNQNFNSVILQVPGPVLVLWGMISDPNTTNLFNLLSTTTNETAFVDIDANPDLAMKFSIRQIPLLTVFKTGMILAQDTSISPVIVQALHA
jgi:thioredoxin-like negative regulator of GroEL